MDLTPSEPPDGGDPAADVVLVVEDDASLRRLIGGLLEDGGYSSLLAPDAAAARSLLVERPVDLVLTDMAMPGESGLDLMIHVASAYPDTAVMMITGRDDPQLAAAALDAGAYGYMIKPFKPTEMLINVSNALRRRNLETENRHHRQRLEQLVHERTEKLWRAVADLERAQVELRVSREETIERLSIAAEFRDDETARHIQRMSRYCALISRRLGWDAEESERVRLASVMHDVGKIGIPDSILLKAESLTPAEFDRMKAHCEIGFRILSGSASDLLDMAAMIALTHHEKIDGSGYPRGLERNAIPIEGRMAAVADVFDALTTDRIYRRAFPMDRAIDTMVEGRGRHFDPDVLDEFLASMNEVLEIKTRQDA